MTFPVVYTKEPSSPATGPQPGTRALYDFINGTFDLAVAGDEIHGLGIFNPRDIYGNPWPKWKGNPKKGSQHAAGRAGDSGVAVVPGGHPEGHRLAKWLVENHAALGIQEVIWAEHRWTNQRPDFVAYHGPSKHLDHVHWCQTDQASKQLTLAAIQAIWDRHPAPIEPPTEDDDDMKLKRPNSGPDKGKVFVVGLGCRQYVDPSKDADKNVRLAELIKQFGPVEDVNEVAWSYIVNATALDIAGLRSIPPAQEDRIVKAGKK